MIEEGKTKAHIQYSGIEILWYTSMIDQEDTGIYRFHLRSKKHHNIYSYDRSRKHQGIYIYIHDR